MEIPVLQRQWSIPWLTAREIQPGGITGDGVHFQWLSLINLENPMFYHLNGSIRFEGKHVYNQQQSGWQIHRHDDLRDRLQ